MTEPSADVLTAEINKLQRDYEKICREIETLVQTRKVIRANLKSLKKTIREARPKLDARAREERFARMRLSGMTYKSMGRIEGISSARAYQLANFGFNAIITRETGCDTPWRLKYGEDECLVRLDPKGMFKYGAVGKDPGPEKS
jgi:hypothetical protein